MPYAVLYGRPGRHAVVYTFLAFLLFFFFHFLLLALGFVPLILRGRERDGLVSAVALTLCFIRPFFPRGGAERDTPGSVLMVTMVGWPAAVEVVPLI